jgi:hypothetical protein
MTYAHRGGQVLLEGGPPTCREPTLRLSQPEVTDLLAAHATEFGLHRQAQDMDAARQAETLFEQLRTALDDQKRWKDHTR